MSLESWLAFVTACTVLSLIPGPSVLLVTGQALTRGTSAAFLCIIGNMMGGIFLITLSLLGVGAILATSPVLFQMVKWAGVCYMAYLGLSQIAAARKSALSDMVSDHTTEVFGSLKAGFLASALTPKTIIFYLAFLTQFMDPAGDPLIQTSILIATSTLNAGLVLGVYALLAARARKVFQSRSARKKIGYAGGGCLLGGSVMIAVSR